MIFLIVYGIFLKYIIISLVLSWRSKSFVVFLNRFVLRDIEKFVFNIFFLSIKVVYVWMLVLFLYFV